MSRQRKWKLAAAGVLVWALSLPLAQGAGLDTLTDRIVGGTALLRAHRPSLSNQGAVRGGAPLSTVSLLPNRQVAQAVCRTDRRVQKCPRVVRICLWTVRSSSSWPISSKIFVRWTEDSCPGLIRLRPSSQVYSYGFIREETCLGGNAAGKRPCPNQTNVLTFRLPRRAARITNLVGEWRDYGLKGKLLVHIDGVRVWRTDVKKKWDRDSKALDHAVPSGATVSLRSENGDPIWLRRFEVKYARD